MNLTHKARNNIGYALSQLDYIEEGIALDYPLSREHMLSICERLRRYVQTAHAELVTHDINNHPFPTVEEPIHA